MKITAEYKGKQVTFDVPDETLDKLIEEPKKTTGWEKPNIGDIYWYLTRNLEIDKIRWSNDIFDIIQYESGCYFTHQELAENIARYRLLDLRIRRRIAEICEPVKCNEPYYGIRSEFGNISSIFMLCNYGGWKCDTEKHAEQIINEFHDELMWYFTEFKDRMDG